MSSPQVWDLEAVGNNKSTRAQTDLQLMSVKELQSIWAASRRTGAAGKVVNFHLKLHSHSSKSVFPNCSVTERRLQLQTALKGNCRPLKDNRATTPVGYCPSTASFSVRPYCKNARWDRCQECHNCFPFGELDWTRTSSNYMDEDYPARPEIKHSLPGWGDNCGSESSTLETDVCVWCYAPLVVHATQEEEEDWRSCNKNDRYWRMSDKCVRRAAVDQPAPDDENSWRVWRSVTKTAERCKKQRQAQSWIHQPEQTLPCSMLVSN